jgi:TetR/AcrR family transcriptional repressor of nem operon
LPAWRCAFGTWRQSDAAASGGQPLTYAKLVDDYLSEAHRDHPGSGCAISALTGEIARSGKRTRALLTEEIRNAFQLIADLTPGQGRGTGEIGSNFNP